MQVLSSQTIRAYHELPYFYQRGASYEKLLADKVIALIAPSWVNVGKPQKNRLVQWLILLTPFLISAVSIGMIIYLWYTLDAIRDIVSESTVAAPISLPNQFAFVALYFASLVVFAISYKQIWKELRVDADASRPPRNVQFAAHMKIEHEIVKMVEDQKISVKQADLLMQGLWRSQLSKQISEFTTPLEIVSREKVRQESLQDYSLRPIDSVGVLWVAALLLTHRLEVFQQQSAEYLIYQLFVLRKKKAHNNWTTINNMALLSIGEL